MSRTFSIYDAKARLSEVIRLVKNKQRVIITERGVPVVQMLPYEKEPLSLRARLSELEKSGVIGAVRSHPDFKPIKKVKGGLARFLADRE